MRGDLDASSIFPDQSPKERQQLVMQARRWLDGQPLSRRVLVKVSPPTRLPYAPSCLCGAFLTLFLTSPTRCNQGSLQIQS